MKHLKLASSQSRNRIQSLSAPVMVTTIWLEDEEGNKISDDEMEEHFQNLTAVGYWVKRRMRIKKAYEKYSFGGLVTSITKNFIILNGKQRIPRTLFHSIYELD